MLEKYNFKDDHGHPIENCTEYIEIKRQLSILEDYLLPEEPEEPEGGTYDDYQDYGAKLARHWLWTMIHDPQPSEES